MQKSEVEFPAGKRYPKDVFLTRDNNGRFHWYSRDPLGLPCKEDFEYSSIEEVLTDFVGTGSVVEPVKVNFECLKLTRSLPFSIAHVSAIRQGRLRAYLGDADGCVVTVLPERSDDPAWPLRGLPVSSEGKRLRERLYSLAGECSDLVPGHRLVTFLGDSPLG